MALLCYAGLQSIPQAYYQAAKIDQASRWTVFRYIELPKMQGVLLIAVLLRFMDSFMIYTEPFVVTGGGPGNSTTFLSIDLVKMAIGQFDLGPAAAFSLMYFLVILLISWVFYTVMTNLDREESRVMRIKSSAIVMTLYLLFLLVPIYWLVNMSLKTNTEITSTFIAVPGGPDLRATTSTILTDPSWYMGYVNSMIYVVMNTVISLTVALPAAYAFSRYSFMGDKHLFFWLLTNRMAPPAVFALPFFQLYSASACSTPISPWPWRIACSTCRWRSGSSKASCAACRRKSTRPPISTAIPSRSFFVKIFMPLIASGIGVAAFFCFMFSWVELLLSRTLTTTDAKPIAATMTRTVSAHRAWTGACWPPPGC